LREAAAKSSWLVAGEQKKGQRRGSGFDGHRTPLQVTRKGTLGMDRERSPELPGKSANKKRTEKTPVDRKNQRKKIASIS